MSGRSTIIAQFFMSLNGSIGVGKFSKELFLVLCLLSHNIVISFARSLFIEILTKEIVTNFSVSDFRLNILGLTINNKKTPR